MRFSGRWPCTASQRHSEGRRLSPDRCRDYWGTAARLQLTPCQSRTLTLLTLPVHWTPVVISQLLTYADSNFWTKYRFLSCMIYEQHLFSRSDWDEHGSLLPKHQSTLSDDTTRSFFLFIFQTGCQTRGPTIRTHNILVLQIDFFLILTDFLRFLCSPNIKPKYLRYQI